MHVGEKRQGAGWSENTLEEGVESPLHGKKVIRLPEQSQAQIPKAQKQKAAAASWQEVQ